MISLETATRELAERILALHGIPDHGLFSGSDKIQSLLTQSPINLEQKLRESGGDTDQMLDALDDKTLVLLSRTVTEIAFDDPGPPDTLAESLEFIFNAVEAVNQCPAKASQDWNQEHAALVVEHAAELVKDLDFAILQLVKTQAAARRIKARTEDHEDTANDAADQSAMTDSLAETAFILRQRHWARCHDIPDTGNVRHGFH